MEKRLKKAGLIALIVAGGLILAALLLGVLNALLADGEWSIGWKDYRYDESGYTVGDGTIPTDRLTGIDVDWIDGLVEIVACDDAFPSVSESSGNELPDSARLRWSVDGDGVLHIKYRSSSWVFGFGQNDRQKKLTVRIPKYFLKDLNSIDIEAGTASVFLRDVTAKEIDVEGSSGLVDASFSELPLYLDISTTSGRVTLRLTDVASFCLDFESKKGTLTSDLPLHSEKENYVYGSGTSSLEVDTVGGDLVLTWLK